MDGCPRPGGTAFSNADEDAGVLTGDNAGDTGGDAGEDTGSQFHPTSAGCYACSANDHADEYFNIGLYWFS